LGEQLLKQYEQTAASEKFEAAVIKIQEAFGTMMEGGLGTLINGLASAASSAGTLYAVMGALGVMSMGKIISQLATVAAVQASSAAASLTIASAFTFGVGTAIIIGAVIAGLATMNSEGDKAAAKAKQRGDVGIKPNGGPIVASLQEGSIFQGTKNDGVEMSPTAGDPNRGGGGGANMTQTNALLQQLIDVISAGGDVTLDGQKVGEALNLASYKVQ